VPVDVAGRITRQNLAKAFQGMASVVGGPVYAAAFLAIPFVLDYIEASQLRVNPAGTGLEIQTAEGCTTSPCYEYTGNTGLGYRNTHQEACTVFIQWKMASYPTWGVINFVSSSHTQCVYFVPKYPGWGNTVQTLISRLRPPDSPLWMPATSAQVYDNLAGTNLSPDYARALLDAGATVDVDAPTVTGPATVAGPSVTTQSTSAAGTTNNTQNTTYNMNYAGDTVTYNTQVVNNTTNPDATTATTVTTAEEDKQLSECEKNPDSLGCVKLGSPSDPDTLSKESVPVVITPATFTGGSCPGPVSFSAFGQSYAFAYTPLCDQLANLAPLFLALAALMSAWIFTSGFRV
jgi:hypothetical protein